MLLSLYCFQGVLIIICRFVPSYTLCIRYVSSKLAYNYLHEFTYSFRGVCSLLLFTYFSRCNIYHATCLSGPLWISPRNISVSELDVNRKYRILQARRLTTRFGPTVILTVKYEDAAPVQVFLPRRYSYVFSDMDIEQINSIVVLLHLIFKGMCPATKAHLRAIEV